METLRGIDPAGNYRSMLDVFIYDAADKIRKPACDATNSFPVTGKDGSYKKVIEILTNVPGINVKETRRKIADKLIEDNSYKF